MATTLTITDRTLSIPNTTSATAPDTISAILARDIHLRELEASLPLQDPVDAEPLESKPSAFTGTDSGYGSASTTPDKTTLARSYDFTEGVAIPARRLFHRTTKLRPFDMEIPQPIRDRFLDLNELLDKPLFEYLTKSRINFTAISIKMKVLGVTEATAKPWIVIQCDEGASKKVKQFFNQNHIRAECQPRCNIDADLPSFQVLVCNRAPRPMAANALLDVFGQYIHGGITSCGSILEISHPDHARFATLGGIIKVGWSETEFTLYGMTAGHVTRQEQSEESDVTRTTTSEEGEDQDEISGELGYEEDDFIAVEDFVLEAVAETSLEADQDKSSKPLSGDTPEGEYQLGLQRSTWLKLGHVSETSRQSSPDTPDLDWALIHMDELAFCHPNYLEITVSRRQVTAESELKVMFHEPKSHEPDCNVVLLSGVRGPKEGKLSTSTSFLMMKPATTFTKTYNLRLSPESDLDAGDCGSWVVDRTTCEVYGHVVAIDAFGDVHVVPLNATFQDIQKKLGAQSIGFPSKDDINGYIERVESITQIQENVVRRLRQTTQHEFSEYIDPSLSSSGIGDDGSPQLDERAIDSGYATMQASPERKHDDFLLMDPNISDTRWNYEHDPMHKYPLPLPANEDFLFYTGSQPEQARPSLADNIGQPKRTESKLEAPQATGEKSYSVWPFRHIRLRHHSSRSGVVSSNNDAQLPKYMQWLGPLGRIGNADRASGIRVPEEAAVDAEEGHSDAAALQPQHQTAQLPVSRIDKSETKSSLPSTNAQGKVVFDGAATRGIIDLLEGLDGL